jgi:hypothetical protein
VLEAGGWRGGARPSATSASLHVRAYVGDGRAASLRRGRGGGAHWGRDDDCAANETLRFVAFNLPLMDASIAEAFVTSMHEKECGKALELKPMDHLCDPYVQVFGGGARQHIKGVAKAGALGALDPVVVAADDDAMIDRAISHWCIENAADVSGEDGVLRTVTEVKDCRHGDRCTAFHDAVPVPRSVDAARRGEALDEDEPITIVVVDWDRDVHVSALTAKLKGEIGMVEEALSGAKGSALMEGLGGALGEASDVLTGVFGSVDAKLRAMSSGMAGGDVLENLDSLTQEAHNKNGRNDEIGRAHCTLRQIKAAGSEGLLLRLVRPVKSSLDDALLDSDEDRGSVDRSVISFDCSYSPFLLFAHYSFGLVYSFFSSFVCCRRRAGRQHRRFARRI